ncbi:LemA family protein [Candidatus Gottesmanbacteria bacterium]|nr:LemA family protein [Candidatus Gottesmanbacteria bacterium]
MRKKHTIEKVLLIIGSTTLVIGLLYVAGTNIYNDPANYDVADSPFDGFLLVPILITLPLFLIKYALDRMHWMSLRLKASWIWIATLLFIGISTFGLFNNSYNYFVRSNETIEKQYAAIDIVYQKRFNLIPNVAKTAKAYGELEQSIVNDITEARKAYLGAKNTDEKVTAANLFDTALRGFVVYGENYPNLKSDALYNQIIQQLIQSEQEIADAKKTYNEEVAKFNKYAKTFPTVLVARVTGFNEKEYLRADLEKEIYDTKPLLDSLKNNR